MLAMRLFILLPLLLAVPVTAARFVATAYSTRGVTASGCRVKKGIIAVDKRIIPLGSRVLVKGIGWCAALDTGRNIKGRRIDLFLSSRGACRRFGVQRVTVTKIVRPRRGKHTCKH